MQIRAVAGDNTFVQGVVLRWYNDSFRLAYGNYPKGVTTIAWISGKTEGIDPKLLRFTVCWKASSSVLPTTHSQTWKASRELCLEGAFRSFAFSATLTSNLGIYATDNRACRVCKANCLIYLFQEEERSFKNYENQRI